MTTRNADDKPAGDQADKLRQLVNAVADMDDAQLGTFLNRALGDGQARRLCAAGCGRDALDGHLTCGDVACAEGVQRRNAQRIREGMAEKLRLHRERRGQPADPPPGCCD